MHSAAILAGGRASRFAGADKSALVVDGQQMLARQLAMLSRVDDIDEIFLVGRTTTNLGIRVVEDRVPNCGPLGGIHTALSMAKGDRVFVLACDMPCVVAPLVTYLLDLSIEADLIVPRSSTGYHPLCAVYGHACLEPIARRLDAGKLKVIDLVEDVRTRVVTAAELDRFGDSHRLLSNVNTPLDHAALGSSHGYQL
jgi:molybdenum cofactor guanylyltransferase